MFSLHDSAVTPDRLVHTAKELGITDITLTDHGNLFGIDDFMSAGKKYGVNTIPGVEAYIPEHFILIAKNYKGYQSIFQAVRDSNEHIEGRNVKKPVMKDDIIRFYFKNNENVIATTACIAGPIAHILLYNRFLKKEEEKLMAKMQKELPKMQEYQELTQIHEAYLKQINTLKEENKAYVNYTKAPYLRQIKEAEERQKQMSFIKETNAEDMKNKRETALN